MAGSVTPFLLFNTAKHYLFVYVLPATRVYIWRRNDDVPLICNGNTKKGDPYND
ncbi:MAG: hypothetical protein PVS3B3_04700 [Ktedonobacteraceae bacterium]